MFKLKNFKILLLLMLFAFAGKDTWATGTKYYSYHIIDVKPSGAGKVYSTSKTENGANTNFNACVDPPYTQNWHTGNSTNTLYLLAKANDGYVFSHWEDQDGTLVASSNPGQVSAHCAQNNSDSGPGDYNGTYYAVFVPTQAVEVYTENADFGTASISNSQNEIGQTITLTAHENLFQHAFVGWRKESNGQIVSNDNPYTFTITEQTRGKYYAVFRDDYSFYRIKNYETGRYMVATNDQGGITNLSSFSLISGIDNVIYDAGSIVQVRIHYAETTAHTREYAIIVQGEDTQEITGAYLRMDRVEANELTLWEPNADGIRAKDNGGENVSLGFYSSADNTKWFFEKLDLDLEGENYFSLDPNKLVEVDGKYYTTLRTSWNILFNPEQMTPYIVKSVNETAGTFEMEAITGNIIPAGTPVIIETKSNVVEENCMVPTTTNAASGAVPTGNLLQVSTKYFPNQAAPVANCKGLIKNADGRLAFGGDALTTVNGNEAYLSVANEVVKPIPTVTLAQLVANGEVGETYEITDLTSVDVVDHDQLLICKDNNGYANKDKNTANYIDYMQRTNGIDTYDQSNWIGLRVPEGKEFTTGLVHGNRLSGVVGRLTDAVNPELQLTQVPTATPGTPASTDLNLYIAASFYGVNHQTGKNDKEYFFVQPKPMELANVEMAQWDGSKFIAPVHDEAHPTWNTAELSGEFEFNGAYLRDVNQSELQAGHIYKLLPAVVKLKPRLASGRDGSRQYVVYPLALKKVTSEEGGVITGLRDLTNPEVIGTDYYNTTGMRSSRPWPGVNIVVTRYSDGSRSAVKVVK